MAATGEKPHREDREVMYGACSCLGSLLPLTIQASLRLFPERNRGMPLPQSKRASGRNWPWETVDHRKLPDEPTREIVAEGQFGLCWELLMQQDRRKATNVL